MIPSKKNISLNDQGQFELSGDMTLKTVATVYHDSLPLFDNKKQIVLDFSRVGLFDSAVISLMLSWIRIVKQQKAQQIVFKNLPDKLQYLITAYRLDEIIRTHS